MITEVRILLGLKPIKENWELKEMSTPNTSVQYYISKENYIEKLIFTSDDSVDYSEIDLSIKLTKEGRIFSKSGKHKPISESIFKKTKPKGITLSIDEEKILIQNHVNKRVILDEYDKDFKNTDEAFKFITNYFQDLNDFLKKQLDYFKFAKKTSRSKLKSGDIFRIRIKDSQFVFGKVIVPIRDSIKKKWPVVGDFILKGNSINAFDPNPNFFPIWVQFFLKKYDDPYPSIPILEECAISKSFVLPDQAFRHSNYEIIGNNEIVFETVDVPMLLETKYKVKPMYHYFNWGAGIVTFPVSETLLALMKKINVRKKRYFFADPLISKKVDRFIDSNLNGNPELALVLSPADLRSKELNELREQVMKEIGLPLDINYDDFALKYGFKSKSEIVDSFQKDK